MPLQSSAILYYNSLVSQTGSSYGILPGAFNPPTEAHLAMARSALSVVRQVIFVLPRKLPHKEYSGVGFETRMELLRAAIAGEDRFQAMETEGGLFVEIARELKLHLPPAAKLHFLCGRDAAERIVNWDYGSPEAFTTMLQDFGLLVAPRGGDYVISREHRHRIATLELELEYQAMSATEVRDRIVTGLPWEHLVPTSIRERVRQAYSKRF